MITIIIPTGVVHVAAIWALGGVGVAVLAIVGLKVWHVLQDLRIKRRLRAARRDLGL